MGYEDHIHATVKTIVIERPVITQGCTGVALPKQRTQEIVAHQPNTGNVSIYSGTSTSLSLSFLPNNSTIGISDKYKAKEERVGGRDVFPEGGRLAEL